MVPEGTRARRHAIKRGITHRQSSEEAKASRAREGAGSCGSEGKEIENVYSFEYLGSRMQCDGDDTADVKYRMDIAQARFSSLHRIWKDHRLHLPMKIRLYTSSVCSTLTHACEAWDLTVAITRQINGFNSRNLSIITGHSHRETATNPVYDLVLAIRKRRMRYAGHIFRMDDSRLVKRTLAAYVDGGRRVPPGSLLQDCGSGSFEELASTASDRDLWQARVNDLQ